MDESVKKVAPYQEWVSPISVTSIFGQPDAPGFPFRHGGDLFYLQSRPSEQGRVALMRWRDGDGECLTPAGFNLRSQVHEYGGRCFCICGDRIVFNNFDDGRLYAQTLDGDGSVHPVVANDDATTGYADLVTWTNPASGEQWVIAVREQVVDGAPNRNDIVAIQLPNEHAATNAVPFVLCKGADFYAGPSVQDCRIAWIQWQLPDMPWDQAALFLATLTVVDGVLKLTDQTAVVDAPSHAVSEPGLLSDGSLVYAMDSPEQDWWNLYRFSDGQHTQLTRLEAEIGQAHWVFGYQRWAEAGSNSSRSIVCIATNADGDRLLQFPLSNPDQIKELHADPSISQLQLSDNSESLLAVVSPEDRVGNIVSINVADGAVETAGPLSQPLLREGYAVPSHVSRATSDGERTHGYFYPPFNPAFSAPDDALPPMVVMVHGGPTSRSSRAFHPLRQYFASLGFAILDVNHRGSTGHGRSYRQRLRGGWGEIDAMDIADLANAMVEDHKADPDALFIRGGSAGGYAVLRALTRYPTLFAGGACYYGIGNLITLSDITHKFEGRYTDSLIGEKFDSVKSREPDSRYVQRSPIFEMDRLQAPLILFQGLKDRVVPPDVTREVVELLKQNDVPHDYVEYPEEGHGFRAADTRIDSLTRETEFFREQMH